MFGGARDLIYRLIKLVIPGLIFVKIIVFAHQACPLAAISEVDWTILFAVVVSSVVTRICIVRCHIADELFYKVMALSWIVIVGV